MGTNSMSEPTMKIFVSFILSKSTPELKTNNRKPVLQIAELISLYWISDCDFDHDLKH
jgi:hypothetical protein